MSHTVFLISHVIGNRWLRGDNLFLRHWLWFLDLFFGHLFSLLSTFILSWLLTGELAIFPHPSQSLSIDESHLAMALFLAIFEGPSELHPIIGDLLEDVFGDFIGLANLSPEEGALTMILVVLPLSKVFDQAVAPEGDSFTLFLAILGHLADIFS